MGNILSRPAEAGAASCTAKGHHEPWVSGFIEEFFHTYLRARHDKRLYSALRKLHRSVHLVARAWALVPSLQPYLRAASRKRTQRVLRVTGFKLAFSGDPLTWLKSASQLTKTLAAKRSRTGPAHGQPDADAAAGPASNTTGASYVPGAVVSTGASATASPVPEVPVTHVPSTPTQQRTGASCNTMPSASSTPLDFVQTVPEQAAVAAVRPHMASLPHITDGQGATAVSPSLNLPHAVSHTCSGSMDHTDTSRDTPSHNNNSSSQAADSHTGTASHGQCSTQQRDPSVAPFQIPMGFHASASDCSTEQGTCSVAPAPGSSSPAPLLGAGADDAGGQPHSVANTPTTQGRDASQPHRIRTPPSYPPAFSPDVQQQVPEEFQPLMWALCGAVIKASEAWYHEAGTTTLQHLPASTLIPDGQVGPGALDEVCKMILSRCRARAHDPSEIFTKVAQTCLSNVYKVQKGDKVWAQKCFHVTCGNLKELGVFASLMDIALAVAVQIGLINPTDEDRQLLNLGTACQLQFCCNVPQAVGCLPDWFHQSYAYEQGWHGVLISIDSPWRDGDAFHQAVKPMHAAPEDHVWTSEQGDTFRSPGCRLYDIKKGIRIMTKMLRAVVHLHKRCMLHNDLKSLNFLIQGEDVWVADFGAATFLYWDDESQDFVSYDAKIHTPIWTGLHRSNLWAKGDFCTTMLHDYHSLGRVFLEVITGCSESLIPELAGCLQVWLHYAYGHRSNKLLDLLPDKLKEQLEKHMEETQSMADQLREMLDEIQQAPAGHKGVWWPARFYEKQIRIIAELLCCEWEIDPTFSIEAVLEKQELLLRQAENILKELKQQVVLNSHHTYSRPDCKHKYLQRAVSQQATAPDEPAIVLEPDEPTEMPSTATESMAESPSSVVEEIAAVESTEASSAATEAAAAATATVSHEAPSTATEGAAAMSAGQTSAAQSTTAGSLSAATEITAAAYPAAAPAERPTASHGAQSNVSAAAEDAAGQCMPCASSAPAEQTTAAHPLTDLLSAATETTAAASSAAAPAEEAPASLVVELTAADDTGVQCMLGVDSDDDGCVVLGITVIEASVAGVVCITSSVASSSVAGGVSTARVAVEVDVASHSNDTQVASHSNHTEVDQGTDLQQDAQLVSCTGVASHSTHTEVVVDQGTDLQQDAQLQHSFLMHQQQQQSWHALSRAVSAVSSTTTGVDALSLQPTPLRHMQLAGGVSNTHLACAPQQSLVSAKAGTPTAEGAQWAIGTPLWFACQSLNSSSPGSYDSSTSSQGVASNMGVSLRQPATTWQRSAIAAHGFGMRNTMHIRPAMPVVCFSTLSSLHATSPQKYEASATSVADNSSGTFGMDNLQDSSDLLDDQQYGSLKGSGVHSEALSDVTKSSGMGSVHFSKPEYIPARADMKEQMGDVTVTVTGDEISSSDAQDQMLGSVHTGATLYEDDMGAAVPGGMCGLGCLLHDAANAAAGLKGELRVMVKQAKHTVKRLWRNCKAKLA